MEPPDKTRLPKVEEDRVQNRFGNQQRPLLGPAYQCLVAPEVKTSVKIDLYRAETFEPERNGRDHS